jgi:hypothetical protein
MIRALKRRSRSLPYSLPSKDELMINIHTHLSPIISIIAGVVILLMPRLLNYIVAIYLILIGIIGLDLVRV